MIFLSTTTHYSCHEQKGSDTQRTGRNTVERYLSQCSSFWLNTMRCNCSLNGDCRNGVLRLTSAEAKCVVQLRLLVHIRKPIGSKTKTHKNNIRSSNSLASKKYVARKGKAYERNKRVRCRKVFRKPRKKCFKVFNIRVLVRNWQLYLQSLTLCSLSHDTVCALISHDIYHLSFQRLCKSVNIFPQCVSK